MLLNPTATMLLLFFAGAWMPRERMPEPVRESERVLRRRP